MHTEFWWWKPKWKGKLLLLSSG